MWKLLLLTAPLLCAQDASMICSNNASTQAQAAQGPAGVSAVLKVSAADDYSRNMHTCMAKYQLLVQADPAGAAGESEILSSDGDWGRRLSIHLDGYSKDGKRVFGIFSEEGRASSTKLFEYDTATKAVKLVELGKDLSRLRGLKCGTSFAVGGTSETGAVVLEPNSTDQCHTKYRWLVGPSGSLKNLAPGTAITGLYSAK
jgi:hypothetical protein